MVSGLCFSRVRECSSVFVALAVIAMLLGPFWWPSSSSGWASFIRIALLLGLLSALPTLRRQSFSSSPMTVALVVLLGYLLVNSCFSEDDFRSARRLALIVSFVIAVGLIGSDNLCSWRRLIQLVVPIAASFALFSILYRVFHGDFDMGYRAMSLSDSGVSGVADFGNTIVAGMHYAFFLVGGGWLMLSTKSRRVGLLWLLCCLVLAVYIYFTFARSSWMAVAAGGLVLICLMTSGRLRVGLLVAVLVATAGAAVVGSHYLMYEIGVRGLTGRNEVWDAVFSRLADHWWFGRGAGVGLGQVTLETGQVVSNTHSLYMEVLFQFGVVGLALFLGTMAVAAWTLYRNLQRSPVAALWLTLLAGIAVVMLVELHTFVGTPGLVWMWVWLPLGGALQVSREARCLER